MLVGLNPVAMSEAFNWICYDPPYLYFVKYYWWCFCETLWGKIRDKEQWLSKYGNELVHHRKPGIGFVIIWMCQLQGSSFLG